MKRLLASPRLLRVTVVALVVGLMAPAGALAQCPRTSLGEVEKEVMCPVCGTPLALATEAPQAQEQRRFIVERIERCESKEEIKTALVAQFGEEVLATPGGDGFDLLGYLLPTLAVLAGVGAIGLAAMRWRRGRPAPGGNLVELDTPGDGSERSAGSGTTPSDRDDARLEADLKRYDL
ncbi:MAG TPA: cytochrome c-type biogenesis protein CcmH [Thermoleophilaceae bacterium]|nr:cytochrome c-type biogenesis protein CcmH [Thermoleophilaceae bacterium]